MYLVLDNLRKMYDENNGVRQFDLSLEKGEFVTLLGPSGCGKTTVLRLLGGYLEPDRGRVLIEGTDITHLVPEERPVSTVFQNYALFANMNVLQNVCYGLRHYRGMPRTEARDMAARYIGIVGLQGYEKTPIQNLSGGQQQRVALARSMAIEPKVLLLDEPFSNLDAALRTRVRSDLKAIQKELNITMVFVTHDQEEALSLSDRIVVMNKGVIHQTGTPKDIYYEPADPFVESFTGGVNPRFGAKPEDLELVPGDAGTIRSILFLGASTEYVIDVSGDAVTVRQSGRQSEYETGQKVGLRVRPSD